MIRLIVAFAVLIGGAVEACANAFDDSRTALIAQEEGRMDAAIELYSSAIASGEMAPEFLAIAYYNRGNAFYVLRRYYSAINDYNAVLALRPGYYAAYNNLANAYSSVGQYSHAIAGFDAAVALRPDYALAYQNRGDAHATAGFYERAIVDYDSATANDPELAKAHSNRGNAKFYLGRFAEAAWDYEAALAIDPRDMYAMLWLHLATASSGAPDRDAFVEYTEHVDLASWPGVALGLYLGRSTVSDVLLAIYDPDPNLRRERQCEAFFYLGAYYRLAGDKAEARRMLRLSLNTGLAHFAEYMGAAAELDRLATLPE